MLAEVSARGIEDGEAVEDSNERRKLIGYGSVKVLVETLKRKLVRPTFPGFTRPSRLASKRRFERE